MGAVSIEIARYPKYKDKWYYSDVINNRKFYIRKFIQSLGFLDIEGVKYVDPDKILRNEYIEKMVNSYKEIVETGYVNRNAFPSLRKYLEHLQIVSYKENIEKYTNEEIIKASCALECTALLYKKILNSPIKNKREQIQMTFDYRFRRNFPSQEEWEESTNYTQLRNRSIRQFTYMTPIFDLDQRPRQKLNFIHIP